MENTKELYNNQLSVTGMALDTPTFTHTVRTADGDVHYYRFTLASKRFSGIPDMMEVSIKEELMKRIDFKKPIHLIAEIRTTNIATSLKVYIFAIEASNWAYVPSKEEDMNHFEATVYTCKAPTYRVTPKGRKITDLTLACIRAYKNRSDYFPAIIWGTNAERANELHIGQKLYVTGRMQSRSYNKVIEGVTTERTAYEVSISDFEILN